MSTLSILTAPSDRPTETIDAPTEFTIMDRAQISARSSLFQLRDAVANRLAAEEGMSTVEYAVGTVAAAAFGALLLVVVQSDSVRSALSDIIDEALSTRG